MLTKAVVPFFNDNLDTVSSFSLIKNTGFDGVMPWWEDDKLRTRADCVKYAEKFGLKICNAHLPFANINSIWQDGVDGDEYTSYLCKLIIELHDNNIPIAVIHPTKSDTPPDFSEIGLDRIKRLVDCAEKHDVKLAFENLRRVDYLDKILSQIDSKSVGFCFDSGHNNCFTPQKQVIAEHYDRLFALHINDNDGTKDMHILPFDGTYDFEIMAKYIAKSNYRGALSAEVMKGRQPQYDGMTDEEYLDVLYRRLCKIDYILEKYIKEFEL